MTSHSHPEYVPGCFRCDLSRDEVTAADRPSVTDNARAEAERRYSSADLYSDLTYPAHALESHRRAAFMAGAEWAMGRAKTTEHTPACAAIWMAVGGCTCAEQEAAGRAETTTEPTDAQVLAALNAMHPKAAAPSLDYWGDKSANEMRAALRAAWTEAGR